MIDKLPENDIHTEPSRKEKDKKERQDFRKGNMSGMKGKAEYKDREGKINGRKGRL